MYFVWKQASRRNDWLECPDLQTKPWDGSPQGVDLQAIVTDIHTILYILSTTTYIMSTENYKFILTKERTNTLLITLILAFIHTRLCLPGEAFVSIRS